MNSMMNLKHMGCCLLACLLLAALQACDNEDDVVEIFTEKTWKLVRVTNEDGKEQFYKGLWNSEKEEENSREALKLDGNFTLTFNLAEVEGETIGTCKAHGIKASIDDASVRVDGKDHTLGISGRIVGSETDKLARVFLNGLLNVYKYEGDSQSMTLYFKDGNTVRVMGFRAQ